MGPLAGYVPPGTQSTSPHLKCFTDAPGVLRINHKICSKNTLRKFMKVTKLRNYKFPGQPKNLLAYSLLAACIFKLQKNGRVTCHRWVNKVTPAGKPERRPNHHKWAGWVVCRANSACSMFPTGGTDLGTEVCWCPRGLNWGKPECHWRGEACSSCKRLFHLPFEGLNDRLKFLSDCFYVLDYYSAVQC